MDPLKYFTYRDSRCIWDMCTCALAHTRVHEYKYTHSSSKNSKRTQYICIWALTRITWHISTHIHTQAQRNTSICALTRTSCVMSTHIHTCSKNSECTEDAFVSALLRTTGKSAHTQTQAQRDICTCAPARTQTHGYTCTQTRSKISRCRRDISTCALEHTARARIHMYADISSNNSRWLIDVDIYMCTQTHSMHPSTHIHPQFKNVHPALYASWLYKSRQQKRY